MYFDSFVRTQMVSMHRSSSLVRADEQVFQSAETNKVPDLLRGPLFRYAFVYVQKSVNVKFVLLI